MPYIQHAFTTLHIIHKNTHWIIAILCRQIHWSLQAVDPFAQGRLLLTCVQHCKVNKEAPMPQQSINTWISCTHTVLMKRLAGAPVCLVRNMFHWHGLSRSPNELSSPFLEFIVFNDSNAKKYRSETARFWCVPWSKHGLSASPLNYSSLRFHAIRVNLIRCLFVPRFQAW